MLIKKLNMKNKKASKKWKSKIDFHGVAPSKIVQFHEETKEALKESICNIEKEILILKEKIKELETTLILKTLFVDPLTTIQPTLTLEGVPEGSSKLKGSSSLLLAVRKYVGDGIQKTIYLIQEIWELAQIFTSFSSRIMHFKEYLQKDLENDEGFYKEVVGMFAQKVSSLSDTYIREHNLPSSI
jgi:hypothetical protein